MTNLMAITVAGWFVVATATAQTRNAPVPAKDDTSQHEMPGMDMSQHDMGYVAGQVTHANQQLQEPENPEMHTGESLPAPELLKEVAARAPVKLPELLQLADASNPTLKQAAAVVRRAAAQAKQAGLYPNPSVGYQGEQIRGGSFGGGEQGAYIAQLIVLGGKLGLRRDIYEQQKKSDEVAAQAQIYRVHSDVTQAFYKTLGAQETVIVRRRLLKLALDAVETVHQLANVGQADAPDILQAEVEGEQAKVDYSNAQHDFLRDFGVLAAVVGRPDLPVSPLEAVLDAVPEINTDQIVSTIVHASPSVKQAQQDVAVAEARLKDAKRESIPDIQLKAGAQYNFESLADAPMKAAGPQSFASAGINIPLWNRNQGNKEAAGADAERARQELQRVQLSLRQQAEPLVQMYLSSKFEADRYRTQLIPRATRAYQLYLKKYQSMAMAYPQVLVSQRTLFQLQISYIEALNRVWQNATALQNYTLKGGLESPVTTGSSATMMNLPTSSGGGVTE